MPGGTKLTPVEQGQINVLKDQGLSLRVIGSAIKRSKDVVSNYLKDPDAYSSKKRKGRARKLYCATVVWCFEKPLGRRKVPAKSSRCSQQCVSSHCSKRSAAKRERKIHQAHGKAQAQTTPPQSSDHVGTDADERSDSLGASSLFG